MDAHIASAPVWVHLTSRVASRHMARETPGTKLDRLRQMRSLSNWSGSGHVRFYDLPLENNPSRYSLVSDDGDYWATVRMEKGKGRGGRLFIEPDGNTVASTNLATPYTSAEDAMKVILNHAANAIRQWGLPEEVPDDSLWTRWFGRSASRVASTVLARLVKEERGTNVYLLGDTFSIKDDLKRKGFRWDPNAKGWFIPADRWKTVSGWIEPALEHAGARPTPLSHVPPGTFPRPSGGTGKASEKQVDYALMLIRKLGPSWHDTDMGQGMGPPRRGDLEKYTSREISEFIDELKSET